MIGTEVPRNRKQGDWDPSLEKGTAIPPTQSSNDEDEWKLNEGGTSPTTSKKKRAWPNIFYQHLGGRTTKQHVTYKKRCGDRKPEAHSNGTGSQKKKKRKGGGKG